MEVGQSDLCTELPDTGLLEYENEGTIGKATFVSWLTVSDAERERETNSIHRRTSWDSKPNSLGPQKR